MSYSESEMNMMGITNSYWGICGFTSSFYTMYETNPGKRPLLLGAGIASRVLAEIKTYLMMLKAEGKTAVLNEIQDFTRSFGKVGKCDFGGFTIDKYIKSIDSITDKTDAAIKADCRYSIAMPPQAVADYLRRIWNCQVEIQMTSGGSGGSGDGILGVRKTKTTPYGGLCHYLYRNGGKIYSWGKVFNSVTDANAEYSVCWFLKITAT